MLVVAKSIQDNYANHLTKQSVNKRLQHTYQKWLRFYLDFCHKYEHESLLLASSGAFQDKLKEKNQPDHQRDEANKAVNYYLDSLNNSNLYRQGKDVTTFTSTTPNIQQNTILQYSLHERGVEYKVSSSKRPIHTSMNNCSWVEEFKALEDAISLRHYSPNTLKSYRRHVRAFQSFTKSTEPQLLTSDHVKEFLTFLAVKKNVAASTQNLAFNSLLFFFRHVLGKEFGKIDGVVRAKKRPYIPVVLSRDEINTILDLIEPQYRLIIKLLYGCGLRLFECLNIRVQCLNLDTEILTIHDGKGKKDRTVPLPTILQPELREHLVAVQRLHTKDLEKGYGGAFLINAIEKKYKSASREFIWQWLFPAKQLTKDKKTGEMKRYHLHPTHVQKALRHATQSAYLTKRVTAHTFRHSYASHLLQNNYDIRTIQELLGHSDVRTTMIYTHTIKSATKKEAKSPLDF